MVMRDCEPACYARRNDINDSMDSLWSEPTCGVVCVSSCALPRRSSSPPWYRPSWSVAQRRRPSFWGSCMISSSRPLRVSLAVTSVSVALRTNDSGHCDVLLSWTDVKPYCLVCNCVVENNNSARREFWPSQWILPRSLKVYIPVCFHWEDLIQLEYLRNVATFVPVFSSLFFSFFFFLFLFFFFFFESTMNMLFQHGHKFTLYNSSSSSSSAALSVFLEDSIDYTYLINMLKALIGKMHTLLCLCS